MYFFTIELVDSPEDMNISEELAVKLCAFLCIDVKNQSGDIEDLLNALKESPLIKTVDLHVLEDEVYMYREFMNCAMSMLADPK